MVASKGAFCLDLQVLNPNLFASSSLKHFICSLFEQLNSNWHGISIPPLLTMSSATNHFNTDFVTTCKKISHYSGELARQMVDRFIALHYLTACLSMGLSNSHLATTFFSD